MSRGLRIVAALFLVAGMTVLGIYVATGPESDIPPYDPTGRDNPVIPPEYVGKPIQLTTPEECAECHREIYEEWKGSHHAFSWNNPEPRRPELGDNFRKKDCIPCHAPRPMLEVGYGQRPLEREERRETGVDCFTCHQYRTVMAGAHPPGPGADEAPCHPVEWAPVAEMKLCSPCHDQHKVQQDWMRSRFAVEGPEYQDCNDCHMPETPGPGTLGGLRKTHRSHAFPGAHDEAMLRTAALMRAVVVRAGESLGEAVGRLTERSWRPPEELDRSDEDRVLIEVKNHGTGHNFPADERHRAADLVASSPSTNRTGVRLTRFRNPYRDEHELLNPFKDRAGEVLTNTVTWGDRSLDLEQVRILPEFNPGRKVFYEKSTQLHAGESRLVFFTPPTRETIRLRLYYKLNPNMRDEDAVVVTETTVEM